MSHAVYDTLPPLPSQLQTLIEGDWEQEVLSQLPADAEHRARELGAFVRSRKLKCVGDLLRGLLVHRLRVTCPCPPTGAVRIIEVDATRLKEPGGCGDDWRRGDLIVADRGYSRRPELAVVLRAGADVIVRLAPRKVPLLDRQGRPFEVLSWLKKQGQHSAKVAFQDEHGTFLGRLLACALPEEATILALLVAWSLLQPEVQYAREVLTQLVEQWAQTQSLTAAEPDAVSSVPTVSSWTTTSLEVQTFRLMVQGFWTRARLRVCLPYLARFLCSRRQGRDHQESDIRRLLMAHPALSGSGSSLLFVCSRA